MEKKHEINNEGQKTMLLLTPEQLIQRMQILMADSQTIASFVAYIQKLNETTEQSNILSQILLGVCLDHNVEEKTINREELNKRIETLYAEKKDLFIAVEQDQITLKIESILKHQLMGTIKE